MSSSAWSFGKSAQRATMGNKNVPGPGNYELDVKVNRV